MSSDTIEVAKRDGLGTRNSRKLRSSGRVPAVIYGHGEQAVHLTVNGAAISRAIHQGTKVLALTGAVTDTALVKDVQWDAFGMDVLHVDFARVSRTEAVEVTVPIEIHGQAPGLNEGGQLAINTHELTILCPASNIPEHIEVNVSQLHMGESILASAVELPEGASLVTLGSEVVVQVSDLSAQEESEEEAEFSAAEPDVILKRKSEEENG